MRRLLVLALLAVAACEPMATDAPSGPRITVEGEARIGVVGRL
jgi:hypothetical protein